MTAPDVHLSPEELAHRASAINPDAVLVPPRILRRVIKQHRRLGGLGLRVPHRKSYWIDRDALLRITTLEELGVAELPAEILLLPQPSPVERIDPGSALRALWRLLFHAAIHREYARLRKAGRLNARVVQERIDRIGAVVYEEAREVLRQEHFLLADDPQTVWEEFAAVFLELRHFDAHRLAQFFPAACQNAEVEELLSADLDVLELYQRTRPAGAAEATADEPTDSEANLALPEDWAETEPPGPLRLRALEASRRGNQVRAAILHQRAVATAPPTQAGGLRGAARAEMETLVRRLHAALGFARGDLEAWSSCLVALLEPAARGFWSVEARLLFDLQKVCLDCEKPLFAVDLVEWLVSWFQRPIKRPLPEQPLVLTVKHLRSAAARVPRTRLPNDQRHQLAALIQDAIHAAEIRQRLTLRPRLIAALDAVGLVPDSTAKRLARDRLVEELLDRAGERGFLSIGDLRDGLARNRVDLPDLSGPVEFLTGDPLIRANRELAVQLDGIYRRGEIYLRWMQRFSSLFFGTRVGRALTLFLIIPILGSLFTLKGIDGISEELHKFIGTPEVDTFHPISFVALALFLLPVVHSPRFRAFLVRAFGHLSRALGMVFWDLPAAFFRLPFVQVVLQSRPFLLFYQYVGKPIAWTVPVVALLYLVGMPLQTTLAIGACWAVLVSILINTRLGMVVEESATDALARSWQLIHEDLLPGLFHWIVWVFRRFLEQVERALYAVDEWLRFRQGEGRLRFAVKLVLGLVWFAVTYVVRFVVNLLIEPQINPIKHFPVVTVSHKLMLVIADPIAVATAPRIGWGLNETRGLVVGVLGLIPGIFGFLAWELKENWRLYRANQSATLDPEMVGSHGEDVIHLLRPGFHSGTLPKLFARLRRSQGSAEHKRELGLHHVAHQLQHFAERDLVAVLSASQRWRREAAITVGQIDLATNRIRIELHCPALPGGSLVLEFAHRAGLLVACVPSPGWSAQLEPTPRQALHDALVGFYKKAGVDVILEDVEAKLPAGAVLDICSEGLHVWTDASRVQGVVYDVRQPDAPPRPLAGEVSPDMPSRGATLLFRAMPLTWMAWVEQWQRDSEDRVKSPLFGHLRLLPHPPS